MIKYYYKARDRRGVLVEGDIDAKDSTAARKHIIQSDLIPISISTFSVKSYFKKLYQELSRFFIQIPLEEMIVFNQQLQVSYSVGIPILRALELIHDQTENKHLKEALRTIQKDVSEGQPLYDAMSKHPHIFNSIYTSLIQAGEASGELEEILGRISTLTEEEAQKRARIKSATFYPKLVVFFMAVVTLVIVYFIIPKIRAFLGSLGAELPPITKFVIGVSDFFVDYWFLILIGLFAGMGVFRAITSTKKGKLVWDQFKLKIPVIGNLLIQIELNSLCVILDLLLGAGIAIIEAMGIVQRSLTNDVVKDEIERCSKKIESGGNISSAFSESKVFPPMFVNLLSVGEESGKLEPVLKKVASYYKVQIDYRLDNLSKLIEPVLLFIIFGMVLVLALAIFLPIWKMSSALKGS